MVLSQAGGALACIAAVLFEVGVARAIPKVYKSPPLRVNWGGGAESAPLPDFPDSPKTAADIDTELSVPFSASI